MSYKTIAVTLFVFLNVVFTFASASAHPLHQPSASCTAPSVYALPQGAPFSKKYQDIRTRFFEGFFCKGMVVEEKVVKAENNQPLNFADQTVHMGFALVTFAGEANILAQAGLSTYGSELAIRDLLNEFTTLDTTAEQEAYGTNEPGFFVRDYVKKPDNRLGNATVNKSDWSSTKPLDKEMSQDQVIHMLVGLWAVKKWAPDQHFSNRAKADLHTRNLINLLKRQGFHITNPAMKLPVSRGAEAQGMAGFLLAVAGNTLGDYQFSDAFVGMKVNIDHNYHAETPEKCIDLYVAKGCIPRIVWWDFSVKYDGFIKLMPALVSHKMVTDHLNANQTLEGLGLSLAPRACGFPREIEGAATTVTESITSVKEYLNEHIIAALRDYIPGIPNVPDFEESCKSLTTITIDFSDMSSILGKWTPSPPQPFVYHMILLGAAFDSDVTTQTFNKLAKECSNSGIDGHGYGHIWAKLLRAVVQSEPVTSNVIAQANDWHDMMPNSGPETNARLWFKPNRWSSCNAANRDSGNYRYNGLDFLSMDVLMHMQTQNQQSAISVAKLNAALEPYLPPAIGTAVLPYNTVGDGVKAAERSGKYTVRIKPGVYAEAAGGTGAFVIDKPVTLVANGGIVTIRANHDVSAASTTQTNLFTIIDAEPVDQREDMVTSTPPVANQHSPSTGTEQPTNPDTMKMIYLPVIANGPITESPASDRGNEAVVLVSSVSATEYIFNTAEGTTHAPSDSENSTTTIYLPLVTNATADQPSSLPVISEAMADALQIDPGEASAITSLPADTQMLSSTTAPELPNEDATQSLYLPLIANGMTAINEPATQEAAIRIAQTIYLPLIVK